MTDDENDPLVGHLVELVRELDRDNVAIVLGGGMSLYLRLRFMTSRLPRYPFDRGLQPPGPREASNFFNIRP